MNPQFLRITIAFSLMLLVVPAAIAMNDLLPEYNVNENTLLSIPLKVVSETSYTFSGFAFPQNAQLTNHNNNTATFQFLPQNGQSGEYMIIIRATPSNNQSPTIEKTTLIKVYKTNSAPEIVQYSPLQNQITLQQGTKQTFIVVAVDADGDSLSYEWRVNNQITGLNNVFEYTAPHSVTGNQAIEARITDGTNTVSRSWTVNVEQVDLLPILIDILSPQANVQSRTAIVSLTTSKDTECRIGERGKAYASLTPLRITGTQYHEGEITGLTEGLVRLRVECRSGSQISGKDIDIMVELPAEAVIKLNKNIPLKDGEVQVLISTDKHLKETPQLQYYYESNPGRKMTVALEPYQDYQTSWIGTLIVPANNEKTQIVFEYSGVTLKGARSSTIIEGRSFPIDTKPPQRIETIQIDSESSRIILRWLSEDEDIVYFTIYRSTRSDITPLDIYRNVNTSILEDTNLSAREYFYSIAAVDRAGNRGPLSRVVSAQVSNAIPSDEQTPTLTTQDKQRINSTINEIDRNLLDLNGAISDLQREKSTARSTREFDFAISQNTELRQELERYRMQLVQLSVNTKAEDLNSLLSTLTNRLSQVRSEATLRVRVVENSEFIQDLNEQNTKGLLQDYLAGRRASEQQISEAQRKIMTIQSLLRIESILMVVEQTKITGEVSYVSIIEQKISYENPDSLRETTIIQRVPQELQDKTFTIEPKETTKSRSIVQHSVGNLGYTPYTITYRVNERLTDSAFKNFYSIAYSDSDSVNIGPTGTSIFTGSGMRKISIIFLGILFGIIAMAGLLYKFGPQLEGVKSKLFSSSLTREDDQYLKSIQQVLNSNSENIQNKTDNRLSSENNNLGNASIPSSNSSQLNGSNQQAYQSERIENNNSQSQSSQPVIEVKYLVRWQNKEPLMVKNNNINSIPFMVRELRSMSNTEYSVYKRQIASWVERNGFSELKDAFNEDEVKSCLRVLKSKIVKQN